MLVSTAPTTRAVKRQETSRRLMRCALELSDEHGFDGWTMDDLAERADVSRRTVFNYFDTKLDVTIGPVHELPPEALQTFLDGGPDGRVVEDFVALAAAVVQEKSADMEMAQLRRSVIRRDPHLAALVNERFESIVEDLAGYILTREGDGYGAERALLLPRLLVTIFDAALCRIETEPSSPFDQFLHNAVADARAVLNS